MAIQWDPTYLKLLAIDNNGPYSWLASGFPNDSAQDGLNNTFLNGDAFYQAWSRFGSLAVATPQGLHVTTFLFEALQETESAQIGIEGILGLSTESHVYGGDFIGQDVTGQLGIVSLRVCSGTPGDDDGDGVENCFDLCPGTPPGETVNADGCGCSQLDCNDGQYCNGVEGCEDGVCQPGEPPTCNDGIECTTDWCDPAANEGAGACVNEPEPAGAPCGDPTDTECDDPDSCDGAGTCLSNYVSAGTACGNPTDDDCTGADTCDGSGACLDNHEPATTECRADAGECDVPEFCDGAGACPVDAFEPADTPCGDPTDTICDNPDSCNGNGTCLDNFEPVTTECRADAGECDVPEFCDGAGACPVDAFEPADTPCGDPTDTICDNPDSCNGNGTCLDNFEPVTTECRTDAGECDVPEFCDGAGACPVDAFEPVDAPCGDPADDDCTDADTCDGSGACLHNHEPDGTACTDGGNDCTDDVCGAGVCTHPNMEAGTACGDPTDTECDDPDTCDGSGTCLPNHEPSGTVCSDGQYCNGEETCDGAGTCQAGGNPCTDPALPFCNEDSDECVECLEISDVDGDGYVDLQDFAMFHGCDTGPVGPVGPPAYPPECRCLDANDDGDVDLADFANFQRNFSG